MQAEQLKSVLAVDDDPTHQKLMVLISDHLGVTLQIASNCSEALRAFATQPFDIVLMDWRMPEEDGECCTKRLRKLAGGDRTPIIAVTALAMPGDRERCLQAGVDDYLSKPFTIEQLKGLIIKWTEPQLKKVQSAQAITDATGR